jgi:hypothetical protein
MSEVRKTIYKEKEVLIVDFSNSKGDKMIDIFEEAKNLILVENRHFIILNIFSERTYISGNFMRHIEKELFKVNELIDKQAIIGLSTVQEWILKGMNLWYHRQIYPFDSMEKAMDFLVE